MLSCELCCLFRAVRLLCLILLQQSSLKKPFFFLKCSVLRGLSFIFGCSMRCPVQLEGRLATVWLPRLRPAVVRLTLAQLFCCSPPRPAAESLRCSVLPQQRQAASAVGVYLSRDRLPQQRQAASAVGVYLSRDGLPRQRLAASAVGVYLSRDGFPRQQLAASAMGVYLSWDGLPL